MVKKKKISIQFILLFFYLICIICLLNPVVLSSASMTIEVLPPKPISGQNFTVSVYDSNLTNETPYLIGVLIEFQGINYTISDALPNREIEITAPIVYSPSSFLINASKDGYNSTNKSITILPDKQNPPRVVITLISDTLVANTFFTLKVTDEWNQPIANATVSIQEQHGQHTDGKTNETGYISLKAPNEQEIIILAQKQGYVEDTLTTWVQTSKDSTQELFSHPFTPIMVAGIILLATIIFVFLKNKGIISKPNIQIPTPKIKEKIEIKPAIKEQNTDYEIIHNPIKNEKAQKKTSKIEEINISKPLPQTETIHLKKNNVFTKKEEKSPSHQWFSNDEKNNETIEEKVDQILSDKSVKQNDDEWFKGTSMVREVIDSSIKEKQKKKKSKST